MLGKHGEARALLERALADAEPDGFALPFAENFRFLEPLLTERLQDGLTGASSVWADWPDSGVRRRSGPRCSPR